MHDPASITVTDFQAIIEQLCRSASDEFQAARLRLERLRREGPTGHESGDE